MAIRRTNFLILLTYLSLAGPIFSQTDTDNTVSQQPAQPGQTKPSDTPQDKRVLGVLPNYRTAEMSQAKTPLTPKQKLTIAFKDSFDYPLVGLAAAYASIYQLEDSHHEFGQGVKGYASRLGTSYADQVDGNMLTEGFLPVLFREDPRYFRMAKGPVKTRAWYAITRIVVTRTDAGGKSFNFAETLGNGIAAGIGLSYYPDDRDAKDYLLNYGTALGTDATSQVLKEFWPDVKRWWKNRHSAH